VKKALHQLESQVAGCATIMLQRTSSANKFSPAKTKKTQKCWEKHGTFEVLSSGDEIAEGEYRIRAKTITCGATSSYLHVWLATGRTRNDWFMSAPKWGDHRFTSNASGKPNFQIKEIRKLWCFPSV
jgi:hypothetical protein